MNRRLLLVVLGMLILGSCATSDGGPPPPITVQTSSRSLELKPYTYCYGNACADGLPPDPLPYIGSPVEVIVSFPESGWSFTASFSPAGHACGRVIEAPLEPTEDGLLLRPVGEPGDYEVELFGEGNGDLVVRFRWTTSISGPPPAPEARLAVLADHDGEVDSYGIELEVRNLADDPAKASAAITVRSDAGRAVSFEAMRASSTCLPTGTLYWDGPDRKGKLAAALGGETFTYLVDLALDGKHYLATAHWPADQIVGAEPSVALNFTPDLPALR
jgi:hypothetical protein